MALFDVIEYEGSGEVLIHRAAQTDFNTHSTLVVRESQKAILIRNGQLADIFDPGRYVLHTQNIPIHSKLVNLPTGGVSPFSARSTSSTRQSPSTANGEPVVRRGFTTTPMI